MVKQALLRDVAEILDLHAQVAARLNAKPQFTAAMRDEATPSGGAGSGRFHHGHARGRT